MTQKSIAVAMALVQRGNGERLMARHLDAPPNSPTLFPIGFVECVGRYQAELRALPSTAEHWFDSDCLRTRVVGHSTQFRNSFVFCPHRHKAETGGRP